MQVEKNAVDVVFQLFLIAVIGKLSYGLQIDNKNQSLYVGIF